MDEEDAFSYLEQEKVFNAIQALQNAGLERYGRHSLPHLLQIYRSTLPLQDAYQAQAWEEVFAAGGVKAYLAARMGLTDTEVESEFGGSLDLDIGSDQQEIVSRFPFLGPYYDLLDKGLGQQEEDWRIPYNYQGRTFVGLPYGGVREQTGAEFSDWRKAGIIQSARGGTPDYGGAATFQQFAPAGVRTDPFTNRGAEQTRVRGAKGRFIANVFEALTNTAKQTAAYQATGKKIVEILLRRYDRLGVGKGGGDQTGTLRKAVANSAIMVDPSPGKGANVSVELADYIRPPRDNEPYGVDTRYYGPRVFKGRRAIQTGRIEPMRYRIHGEWITTANVRASRTDLDIYDFNAEERQEVLTHYTTELRKAMAQAPAGSSSE